jgi:uncharacterized protein YjdB
MEGHIFVGGNMKRLGIMTAALMALSVLFFACDTGGGEDSSIKVTSVTISSEGGNSIVVGDTLKLTAEVKPDNATDKKVTWSSSDEAIATIDASGVVTGKKAGETDIIATGGGVKSTAFKVTVAEPAKVVSVTIKQDGNAVTEPLALPANGNITLTAEVLPSNTTSADKIVTWASSHETVATVANGVVTWVGEGTATITATAAGKDADGATVSDTVTVNAAADSTGPVGDAKLIIFNQAGAVEGTTAAGEVADTAFNADGRLVIKNTNTSSGWGTDLSAVEKNTFVYLDTPLTAPFSISARVKITNLIASASTDNGIFVGAFTDPTVDNSSANTKGGEPENTEKAFIAIAGVNSATNGRRSIYGTRLNNKLINNSAGSTQFYDSYNQEYVYTVKQGVVGTYNMLVTDDAFNPPRPRSPYEAAGTNRSGDTAIYSSLGKAGDAEINNPLYLGIIVSGVEAEISNIIIKQGDEVVYSKSAPATPYLPVQSVSITNEAGASVEAGKLLQMTASVSPEGAYQGVTWKVDENDVQYAEIDPTTGALTGLDEGTAKVYATSIDNNANGVKVESEAFTVTVTKSQEEVLENNRSWNFQELPVGWTDGTNTGTGIDDYDYGQGLLLASSTRTLRITAGQSTPSGTEGWSKGVLQLGGVSPSLFATIKEVQGPFTLTFNYSGTGGTGDEVKRRIKVKIGETETDPGEEYAAPFTTTPKTWVFTYTGTDKVDVQLHGVVNSVRLYDLILAYTGQ